MRLSLALPAESLLSYETRDKKESDNIVERFDKSLNILIELVEPKGIEPSTS